MSEVEQLFEKLNIQETSIKTTFELEGYKFWINKGKGVIRRRQQAALSIPYLWDDRGLAAGKYDDIIESTMKGVVAEGDPPVELSGDGFEQWLGSVPELSDDGEAVQMAISMTLPRVVVMVILGKPQVLRLMGNQQDGLTLQSSQESSAPKPENIEENQSTKKPLKKPVRALPKVVKILD